MLSIGFLWARALPCKAKWQYLLTFQVSRYCHLALQSRCVLQTETETNRIFKWIVTRTIAPCNISWPGLTWHDPNDPVSMIAEATLRCVCRLLTQDTNVGRRANKQSSETKLSWDNSWSKNQIILTWKSLMMIASSNEVILIKVINPFKPWSSSSTTSRELLSQFSTCSGWWWFDVF